MNSFDIVSEFDFKLTVKEGEYASVLRDDEDLAIVFRASEEILFSSSDVPRNCVKQTVCQFSVPKLNIEVSTVAVVRVERTCNSLSLLECTHSLLTMSSENPYIEYIVARGSHAWLTYSYKNIH